VEQHQQQQQQQQHVIQCSRADTCQRRQGYCSCVLLAIALHFNSKQAALAALHIPRSAAA
jgi:hypothetical protein